MIMLLWKPCSMATRILMNNFVFCSQVKFIFGTLGKRKSINYFVAMETSLLVTVRVMFLFGIFVP